MFRFRVKFLTIYCWAQKGTSPFTGARIFVKPKQNTAVLQE